MINAKRTVLLILFLALAFVARAQGQAEMADTMRSNGKIYVVVAIIVIVLSGFFLYLFMLDRKIKRLENILREKHTQTK